MGGAPAANACIAETNNSPPKLERIPDPVISERKLGSATSEALGAAADQSLYVFSSTNNPVLPSQLEPVGNVFSTSCELEITASTPPWAPVIGTGTARGVCARSSTRCQSISLSCSTILFCSFGFSSFGQQALAVVAPIA